MSGVGCRVKYYKLRSAGYILQVFNEQYFAYLRIQSRDRSEQHCSCTGKTHTSAFQMVSLYIILTDYARPPWCFGMDMARQYIIRIANHDKQCCLKRWSFDINHSKAVCFTSSRSSYDLWRYWKPLLPITTADLLFSAKKNSTELRNYPTLDYY